MNIDQVVDKMRVLRLNKGFPPFRLMTDEEYEDHILKIREKLYEDYKQIVVKYIEEKVNVDFLN